MAARAVHTPSIFLRRSPDFTELRIEDASCLLMVTSTSDKSEVFEQMVNGNADCMSLNRVIHVSIPRLDLIERLPTQQKKSI